MPAFVAAVREKAAQTPARRERHVDFLRAVAICVVVLGHWTAIAVVYEDGVLDGVNALDVVEWADPLTWVLQVMPIFFFVGGFANAASLRSAYRDGGDGFMWVLSRTGRLIRPVTALFVLVPLAAIVAVTAGVAEEQVGAATWLASIPLWFLLAYVSIVALAPIMHALHRRWGLGVLVALVAAVAIADVLRMGLEVPYVGESSYLLGWLAIHQAGFCWFDERLPSGRDAWLWTGTALAVTVALTVGPYDVQMVGDNTDPPTLALMSLAATQVGVVLLLRAPVDRWLQQERPWSVVVGLNAIILTMFVWHMTAAVISASILYPTGVFPQPEIGSAAWFAWRVPWLLATLVVLAVLVMTFARIEIRSSGLNPPELRPIRNGLTLLGLLAVLGGLGAVAVAGRDYHGLGGLPPAAVLAFLAGAALLRAARSAGAWRRPTARTPRN